MGVVTVVNKYLTIEQFEKWLDRQPENRVIGAACSGSRCPIAQYLNEVLPLQNEEYVIVNQLNIHITNRLQNLKDHVIIPVPSWVNYYTFLVDHYENSLKRDFCKYLLELTKIRFRYGGEDGTERKDSQLFYSQEFHGITQQVCY